MDAIKIENLRLSTRVGVTEEERSTPQVVLVSLEVGADLSKAAGSDDVMDTIDYASLVEAVSGLVGRAENRLLEKLAGDIAAHVEAIFGVPGITVEVAKADPPLKEEVERVAVRIERRSR